MLEQIFSKKKKKLPADLIIDGKVQKRKINVSKKDAQVIDASEKLTRKKKLEKSIKSFLTKIKKSNKDKDGKKSKKESKKKKDQ